MSFDAFKTLRDRHSMDSVCLDRLEGAVRETLRSDQSAVIEETYLSNMTGVEEEKIYRYLIELASIGALRKTFFWQCPNKYGRTIAEFDTLAEIPDLLDCDACGEYHQFNAHDVFVSFLATGCLIESINPETGPN